MQEPFSFLKLCCLEIYRTELAFSMNMGGYLKGILSCFLQEVGEEAFIVMPSCSGVESHRIFRAISFIARGANDVWYIAVQAEATSRALQYIVGKLSNDNVILA